MNTCELPIYDRFPIGPCDRRQRVYRLGIGESPARGKDRSNLSSPLQAEIERSAGELRNSNRRSPLL